MNRQEKRHFWQAHIDSWQTGFWLYYKRLEKGCFRWPTEQDSDYMTLTRQQLGWLLDGLGLTQKQAHQPLSVHHVI